MLATLIQRYNKKIISFQERETNRNFTGCQLPHFMIVLISDMNLLNLYWIMKCLFLENMEPLRKNIKAHDHTLMDVKACKFSSNYSVVTEVSLFSLHVFADDWEKYARTFMALIGTMDIFLDMYSEPSLQRQYLFPNTLPLK